jgi:carbamoyl-phosphate synthase large subunit
MLQFAGQTGLNLAGAIHQSGAHILGSSFEAIDLGEDRRRCERLLRRLGIPTPHGGAARSHEEALAIARRIGFPVVVRPSYVLGGRDVVIVRDEDALARYLKVARGEILVDQYLEGRELDVDAICDGKSVLIPGILEQLEPAGIHSGDSVACYPPPTLTPAERDRVRRHTEVIAHAIDAVGLINIQYVVRDGQPWVLEINPRSSRTVPFLSKATGVPMVRLATLAALGRPLPPASAETATENAIGQPNGNRRVHAVKAPVFSTARLPGVDPRLGPEMQSTGEAMGLSTDPQEARRKAQPALQRSSDAPDVEVMTLSEYVSPFGLHADLDGRYL